MIILGVFWLLGFVEIELEFLGICNAYFWYNYIGSDLLSKLQHLPPRSHRGSVTAWVVDGVRIDVTTMRTVVRTLGSGDELHYGSMGV